VNKGPWLRREKDKGGKRMIFFETQKRTYKRGSIKRRGLKNVLGETVVQMEGLPQKQEKLK